MYKYSIIIPVFNIEQYISQCIDSILKQTYGHFELILVDDGSSDRSPIICEDYALKDSRITVIHKKNEGPLSARKMAANAAKGDYIISVDGDDYVPDNMLETIDCILKHYDIDVVCFDYQVVPNETISLHIDFPEGYYEGEKYKDLVSTFVYNEKKNGINGGAIPYSIWSKAVQTDLYRECQNKVPDTIRSGEDLLFTAFLLSKIDRLYISSFIGYYYRTNEHSITNVFRKGDICNAYQVFNELLTLSEGHPEIQNQACVYLIWYLWALCICCAKTMSTYKEFKKILLTEYDEKADHYLINAVINNPCKKDMIKIKLLTKHKWYVIFLLAKYNQH